MLVGSLKAQGGDGGKLSCSKSLANYDNAHWAFGGSCSRRDIHPYCFRNAIYLLCMMPGMLFHMDPVMNNQPNPLNAFQE